MTTPTTLQTPPPLPAPVKTKTARDEYHNLKGFSIVFTIAAMLFTIIGIFNLYSQLRFSDKIVGGDAYNILIYQVRGAAWICVGICNALIALIFAVYANAKHNKIPLDADKGVVPYNAPKAFSSEIKAE